MQPFKFFQSVKIKSRPLDWSPQYNHFSYPNTGDGYFGGEMNVLFTWAIHDNRPNDYRLQIFQGAIKHFARTYEDAIIEDDEILFMFPTIESISIMSDYTNIAVGENYEFTDPDEIVCIFYKIYTR